MKKRRFSYAHAGVAALVIALLAPVAAFGEQAASPWQTGPKAAVRLIAATTAVGNLATVPVGVEVKLQPGWKTYWRTPGDAGLAPQVDFAGSDNVAATQLRWPAPSRFRYFDLETIGYSKEVVFPVDVTPAHGGEPMTLRARVDLLVCADVCIPHTMDVALNLPAGPAMPSDQANLINRFRLRVPGDGSNVGLHLEAAKFSGPTAKPQLAVAFRGMFPFAHPDVLVEGPPEYLFSLPKIEIADGGTLALARMTAENLSGTGAPVDLAAQPITFTLVDGARTMEAQVTPTPGPLKVTSSAAQYTALLSILGLALLGGLILNLMPCVLPVLSIKLLSVISHGGAERRLVRLGFLATTAGIIVSFLALATLAVAVKAAGMAVGWGIQFQQPLFIIAMVVILTLFAANLWGLYEIALPGRLTGAAARAGGGTSLRGNFFQGAFATLLATPCSAPFLGTSIGFALSRGATEIYAVFAALGVGMALPFVLVAVFPGLAAKLPKPGPWMVWVKKILALALAATAVWLLSVMGVQVSPVAAAVVGALMVALAGLLAVRHATRRSSLRALLIAGLVVVVGAFATPAMVSALHLSGAVRPAVAASEWRPFDRAAIPQLIAAGNVVFVDVTADWCITCQVNKARVLDVGDVARTLASPRVIAMKADWTKPSEEIATYLASFNRFGIPFNVIYGPNAPGGVVLPELLSNEAVLSAFAQAGFHGNVASAK